MDPQTGVTPGHVAPPTRVNACVLAIVPETKGVTLEVPVERVTQRFESTVLPFFSKHFAAGVP